MNTTKMVPGLKVKSGVRAAGFGANHNRTLANVSSLAFGGPDRRTAYLGSVLGNRLLSFRSPVAEFYLTNPVARASVVMNECSALARGKSTMTAAE